MNTWEFEVGILLCRPVRDYLKRMKFYGHDIDFVESSGWLSRTFSVRGSANAISALQSAMVNWKRQLDQPTQKEEK